VWPEADRSDVTGISVLVDISVLFGVPANDDA
jgi:hypothetical protein